MGNGIKSINPASEELLASYEPYSKQEIENRLRLAQKSFWAWSAEPISTRVRPLRKAAAYLNQNKPELAGTITREMGKPIAEAEAEIEKCSTACVYYADHAEQFLDNETRISSAAESYIQYSPLGVILGIMPWNFPFWQVFRFAVPALMAGNGAILKHASNVPQCALAIETVFRKSGFPEGLFQTLLVESPDVPMLIEHPTIAAVTLTGSEGAGKEVAALAGRALKKSVMELGGSDPFIVLADADIEEAVRVGVRSRYQNTGQSCIAAKRFIVVDAVYDEYQERFVKMVGSLKAGDPMERTTQIGPLARGEFRDELERQIADSVAQGAAVLTGGRRKTGKGYFFEPTVLSGVRPEMPAGCTEVFGPVAALFRVRDIEEAIQFANRTPYGLGSNLWTSDVERAKYLARRIEAGQVFINGMVASHPGLPFGGIKRSGYGRELSELGLREFVNIQTVWIGPPLQN